MFNDKNLSYVIIKRTIVSSLIIIGIIFLGIKNPKSYVLGLIFGTIISVLGFKLIEMTINRSIKMTPKGSYRYIIAHYFMRYFIYAIVLVVGAVADYLSFITTIIGLFMTKLVILVSSFFDKKGEKKNNNN